jgi:hypothetical protein
MNKGKIEIGVVKSTEKKEASTEGRNETRKIFMYCWKISILHCLSSHSASHKAKQCGLAEFRGVENPTFSPFFNT